MKPLATRSRAALPPFGFTYYHASTRSGSLFQRRADFAQRIGVGSESAFPFCEGNDLLSTASLLCHQGAHHFSDVSAEGLQNGGSIPPDFFDDFILHFLVLQKVLSGCK